tara:strand:+ start:29927 stop:30637 length:711 start_codon:yes stop_codon:yes gene_type:complete
MGFLDNSTNNVLIDAVLTDAGRRAMALNNGSFAITKFALGDDEVDYTIIKKFGTTVGKEKIIKNTPVFEAQTHGNLAIKHKLLSLSSNTLIRLPSLQVTLEGNTSLLSMTVASDVSANKRSVQIAQSMSTSAAIGPELYDGLYEIKMQNRFLYIPGQTPVVDTDNIATYLLNAGGQPTSQRGSRVTFSVATRPINQFNVYATYNDTNMIRTYINAKGFFTGAQANIEVQIRNTTAA